MLSPYAFAHSILSLDSIAGELAFSFTLADGSVTPALTQESSFLEG